MYGAIKSNLQKELKEIKFDKQESKHIFKVLRKQEGSVLNLTNGKGFFFKVRLIQSNLKNCVATVLEVTKQEKELEIAFNIHYLISVLEKLTSKEVNMVIPGGENKSCLLSAMGDESYQYIIMPMRI